VKKIILILFTLQYLQALPSTITIPPQIQQQLCQKLSDQNCNQAQQLHYSHYFKLDNDALLLFFHLYRQNSLNPHGSLNVPVIVDMQGKWKTLKGYMKDEIQEIQRDPNNGIWLHTVSKSRSGYSSLYYSKKGVEWQKIKLPSIRTFQTLQLCFQQNELILTFQRVENDNVKAWVTTYSNALSTEPSWRLMEKKELYQKNCKQTSAYNNAWSLKKQNGNRILFTHKYKNRAISIPKKSSTKNTTPKIVRKIPVTAPSKIPKRTTTHTNNKLPYSIQIGTFNYETSLPLLYQEFQLLKDLLITKKIIKNEQVQYKVYLGSFPDLLEAQVKLQELRSEYINSKTLKSAFITKRP
jgi:hypothetical protein